MTGETIRNNPEQIFEAADALFLDIPYENGTRNVTGTLYVYDTLPLIPVGISDTIKTDGYRSREIEVILRYLLSDASRVDQSVRYVIRDTDTAPGIIHHVQFGDTWGKEIPFEPFFNEPASPTALMAKAIQTVHEKRQETKEEFRKNIWPINKHPFI